MGLRQPGQPPRRIFGPGDICTVPGCDGTMYAKEVCRRHYKRKTPKEPKVCSCGELVQAKSKRDVCKACYNKNFLAMYYQANKPQWAEYQLKRKYGITTAQRDAMLVSQGDKCAGCGVGPLRFMKNSLHGSELRAVVDHCHASGKVRGILCNQCNLDLGRYERVQKWAPEYLGRSV